MKYILYSILLILSVVFASCSGSVSETANDSEVYAPVASSDTIVADTAVALEPEPEPAPHYTATTSNEAIELMNSLPDAALYNQGILPRMSEQCLEYAMRLLNTAKDGFIIVDKEAMHLALYDKYGREILRYGIGCARKYGTKHSKGDSRTPEGFFSVEGIYDSTDWLFRDDNGKVSKVKGQFGPRFIRLRIPGTSQIGIHGTRAPWSIGTRCSHGCIRVTNEHILDLVQRVKPGMPVIVSPSRRDEKVNLQEGYSVPWVSIVPTSRKNQKVESPTPAPDTASTDTTTVSSHPTEPSELPAEFAAPAAEEEPTPASSTEE
ncbi:MAG: L,D-transpeptidase family protein [Muribaculaceae bacterium]|nr:L,D-transpeptidase family protein [Muribaculaceae bacterium]